MSEPRILLWDIETTNLNANFGYILCSGFKWLDEDKAFTLTIDDHPGKKVTDDSQLVKAMADVLNSADVWVTYYGKRFDVPYVQTRLFLANPKWVLKLDNASHIDLWDTVKRRFRLNSNRLETVINTFGLKNKKSPVLGPQWLDAQAGIRSARKYVYDHCDADVLALEEAYLKIRPLIRAHPTLNPVVDPDRPHCVACGGKVQWRGRSITSAKTWKRRYQCKSCGRWGTA